MTGDAVLAVLREHPAGMSQSELQALTGLENFDVLAAIRALLTSGEAEQDGELYRVRRQASRNHG